jgi:hypothetical protein
MPSCSGELAAVFAVGRVTEILAEALEPAYVARRDRTRPPEQL